MQSETANYHIHQPTYQNKYNEGWNPTAENFSENGEHFYEDYMMTPSQFQYGDLTDDVTPDSVLPWFASDSRSVCSYSCQGNRPNDTLARVGCQDNVFNDNQVSMQQHPFHYFNQPMDHLASADNWTATDYQSHSDSDSSLYSPGVEKAELNSVRSWAVKQEQFESQNFLSSPHSLNENQIIFNQLSINHSETQLFNLDDRQHYRLEALSSSGSSNAFIPPSNNTGRLETIKAELWHGAAQTWSHSLPQPLAANPPVPPPTQIINNSQNKILKRRLRRRRRRGADKEKTVHLWEFIRDILLEPKHCPSLMKWEDRGEGVFRFVKSNTVASMWGKKKDNPKMTYEKLSRAMRYYYNRGILERVDGRRLVYKFGPNAHGWKSPVTTDSQETKISTSEADDADVTSPPSSVASAPNTPSSENKQSNLVSNFPPLLLPSAEVLLEKNGTFKGS